MSEEVAALHDLARRLRAIAPADSPDRRGALWVTVQGAEDPPVLDAKVRLRFRLIEITAWVDGLVTVGQRWTGNHSLEALDLNADLWPILDVLKSWQATRLPREEPEGS